MSKTNIGPLTIYPYSLAVHTDGAAYQSTPIIIRVIRPRPVQTRPISADHPVFRLDIPRNWSDIPFIFSRVRKLCDPRTYHNHRPNVRFSRELESPFGLTIPLGYSVERECKMKSWGVVCLAIRFVFTNFDLNRWILFARGAIVNHSWGRWKIFVDDKTRKGAKLSTRNRYRLIEWKSKFSCVYMVSRGQPINRCRGKNRRCKLLLTVFHCFVSNVSND